MNDILDLLPVPAERDLPAARLSTQRDALVAAVAAEPKRALRRVLRAARGTWLALLGIVALGLALLAIGVSGPQRPSARGAVALVAVAGAVQVAALPRLQLMRR